jgi:diguanylate cyclase (GGDEF)-like protein
MNENELTHAIAREHVNLASGLLSMMVPQSAGTGVGLKGLDGRYQIVNPILETLAGLPVGAMTGKTDPELFAPDIAARLHQGDQDIATGAVSFNTELDFTVNGEPTHCQCLKFPVAGADGTLLMIGTVLLPVAGQDAVEGMLQSLERLQQTNRELLKSLASIDRQARMDKLTGAWNRRRLEEAVANEMERLHRYDHPLSLLLVSLDGFQQLNAELGTQAGDRVLFETAIVLQASLRATDALARWSDDQFAVLCPNTTQSTATVLAGQLREKVAAARFTAANTLTLSIGVAECGREETPDQWFDRADAAMFKARVTGRNRVQPAAEIPGRASVGENVAASFVQLSWRPAYDCGNAVIDAQHRAMNDLTESLPARLLKSLLHARRAPDLWHSRRLRPALLPHHRRVEDPAAVHAVARARRGLRGRRVGAHQRQPGRGGGDLRRRRAEHDQRGRRGLCRKVAAGGALGRAGQGRIALRPAAAPPGQDAGFAVPDLQGNHLRPGAPGRRRARAGRHRPRAGQLPAPLASRSTSRSRATW